MRRSRASSRESSSWQNLLADGWPATSPVGSFPPNRYGLLDMTGNLWEWTTGTLDADKVASPCCAPHRGDERFARRVIKGGSRLCAPNHCLRFRPAARQSETNDASTTHTGFRCIVRDQDRA